MTGKHRHSSSLALAIGMAVLVTGTVGQAKTDAAGQSTPVATAVDTGNAHTSSAFKTVPSGPIRLAAAAAASPSAEARGAPLKLEQVVVTAEKRNELLEDTPVPVTALDASSLLLQNQVRIEDYFSQVPGMTYTPNAGRGFPTIAIRGIVSAESLNPTVGVEIDGLPLGSSSTFGGGFATPDIDPSELSRIEVLRGPQGTLYGANSMGGLLKYVTIDPSTDMLTGHVAAGYENVQNGAEPGYNVRAGINIPLGDSMAVRASAYTREDPGYVDDPVHNLKGVNEAEEGGGRLAALWRPSDDFSVKFSGFFQRNSTDGSSYSDMQYGLDTLQQDRIPDTGTLGQNLQAYSITLNGKIGAFDLTSISGYSTVDLMDTFEVNPAQWAANANAYDVPGSGIQGLEDRRTAKWSEEDRLSVSIGSNVDWLLGVFYTHESSSLSEDFDFANPNTGTIVELFQSLRPAFSFQEAAVFTDFTFKITDRFDIQIGGRESDDRQRYQQHVALLDRPTQAPGVTTTTGALIHQDDDVATFLLTPRWKLVESPTGNAMLYARIASGFRPGGPNSIGSPLLPAGVPATFGPDRTIDYEIGLKGDALDRKLFVDASAFYIDWKNIQIAAAVDGVGVFANGNDAKSEGVELSTRFTPLAGLTLGLNATWDHAVLTQPLPATASASFGTAGAPLPFTARFTGNFTMEDDFPLTGELQGFVAGQETYVGQRYSVFAVSAVAPRQVYPAYAVTNLRGGVKWETWTVDVYSNNVGNRRALLGGGLPETTPPGQLLYIMPVMVGVELSKLF